MAGESSPWARLEEPFDPEALERLQPRALPRTRSLQEWVGSSQGPFLVAAAAAGYQQVSHAYCHQSATLCADTAAGGG